MALMRALSRVLTGILVAVQCAAAASSAEIVNAAFRSARLDLAPLATLIRSDSASVEVEAPGDAGPRPFVLRAEGSGPVYRWAVFTLRNPEPGDRVLILSVPREGFAGSGLIWPAQPSARVLAVRSLDGALVEPVAAVGREAFAIPVGPSATSTFAVQLATGDPSGLALWQRPAFEQANAGRSFVSGALLGIGALLAFVLTVVALLKRGGMYWSGAAFAWPALVFAAIELGYLPAVAGLAPQLAGHEAGLRACVEALMLAGLAGLLASLFDARGQIPALAGGAVLVAGAALGLAIYAWLEPDIASGLARIGFAAVAGGGLAVLMALAWRDAPRARASLPFWLALALWTVLAGVSATRSGPAATESTLLAAGLVAVLALLAIALSRFGFGQGLVSKRLMQEAERQALALAGAGEIVWDWQASRGRFHVGPEIDRVLGFESGTVGARSLKGWLELLHPADRAAYVASIEATEQRGRGTFSHEFRLRRGDGAYRWFHLRARAMHEPRGGLRLVGALSDVTTLRRSEDRLLSDAVHDRVTGLPNRALFLDRLEREVRRASPMNDLSLHVVVVGLDRFKSLNEGLGHEVGDSLLGIAGRRLGALMGPEDTLARLRGDQFAVIFHAGRPQRDVHAFVEGLRETLARPISVRPREVALTASFGVARLRHPGQAFEELLRDAEIAMHEAKRKGRATIEFYHPDMRDERSRLLSLEQDLRRALERNEIEVVFQPIMRLKERDLAGFEALMRWRRGGEVLVQPDSFIGLAEELGIIRELGRHVLAEAIRQAGIWHRAFRPREPIYVAVNLSSAELLNADLVDEVRALLNREDVKPQALKLEVTESLVMQNPELAERVLHRLRQFGVGLACDDFGTGYSALANLRWLPFDTLKVDKSFLDHELDDERAAILLESVLMLAHDLGLAVIAEGIESEEQLGRLVSLGCGYGQGFHIGAPATARQVIEALGGLPYGSGGRGTGVSSFWARFVGRREPARPPLPPIRLASEEDIATPAEESPPAGIEAAEMEPDPGPDTLPDWGSIVAASADEPPPPPEELLAEDEAPQPDADEVPPQAEELEPFEDASGSGELPAGEPLPPAPPPADVQPRPFAPRLDEDESGTTTEQEAAAGGPADQDDTTGDDAEGQPEQGPPELRLRRHPLRRKLNRTARRRLRR